VFFALIEMVKGEGGETLRVIDKEEAWVFHVLTFETVSCVNCEAQRVLMVM
jgi:hypothetical protein